MRAHKCWIRPCRQGAQKKQGSRFRRDKPHFHPLAREQAKNIAEQHRVSIRNIRRDGNDELKKLQKDGLITEDDLKTKEDELQKSTDKFISEINKIFEEKEKEIMD